MNDYVVYQLATQRQAELTNKVRRSRPIRSRSHGDRSNSLTANARQRLAAVAYVLTNRTRTATADY